MQPGTREAQYPLQLEGVVLHASALSGSPMLAYVRLLVRLIDGRRLSRTQLLALLVGSLRQRSIAGRSRRAYVLEILHQHPP